jgi:hypothetical protein
LESLRLLLSVAAIRDLELRQLDIVGAFLDAQSRKSSIYSSLAASKHQAKSATYNQASRALRKLVETGRRPLLHQILSLDFEPRQLIQGSSLTMICESSLVSTWTIFYWRAGQKRQLCGLRKSEERDIKLRILARPTQ